MYIILVNKNMKDKTFKIYGFITKNIVFLKGILKVMTHIDTTNKSQGSCGSIKQHVPKKESRK